MSLYFEYVLKNKKMKGSINVIIDKFENAKSYYGISKEFAIGLNFLQNNDLNKKEPGKYEIDGDNIFLLIKEYNTIPFERGKWEAHRRYIDIQYIIEGNEVIGYANIDCLKISEDYMEDRDIFFLKGSGDFNTLNKGWFAVYFPEDAHMPCLEVEESKYVKKAIMKILV